MAIGNADDSADELATLSRLKADGALTDDEFKAAEARLLGRNPDPPATPDPPPGGTSTVRPTRRPDPQASPPPATLRIGSRHLPTKAVIGASFGAVLLIVLIGMIAQPTGLKARALGAWSCRDAGADRAVDYIIGDGVYSIPTYQRGGTWSLDGTSLTIHETKNYGDDLLDATTTIHLTSPDQPTGATISYAANYSSGNSDLAEGDAHYDGETVVVHLQHSSSLNTGADDVTCTKR